MLIPKPVPPKGIDQDTTRAPAFKGTSLPSVFPLQPAAKASATKLPVQPASTKNLVPSLVNKIFLTLNDTSSELVEDCWLYYHSQPPFYERTAVLGDTPHADDPQHCHWQKGTCTGLSLTQISACDFV